MKTFADMNRASNVRDTSILGGPRTLEIGPQPSTSSTCPVVDDAADALAQKKNIEDQQRRMTNGVTAFFKPGVKIVVGLGLTTVSGAGIPGLVVGGLCTAAGLYVGHDRFHP